MEFDHFDLDACRKSYQELSSTRNQVLQSKTLLQKQSRECAASTKKQRQQPIIFDYSVHDLISAEGAKSFDELPPFNDVGEFENRSRNRANSITTAITESSKWTKQWGQRKGKVSSPNYAMINLIIK